MGGSGKRRYGAVGGGRCGRRRYVAVGGGMGLGALLATAALSRPCPPPSASYRPYRHDIHAEYIKYPSGADSITAYLAYPERADRAPAVVVIHEIFGMSDFVRSTTEQFAKDGFVALAPDLLTRRGGTPNVADIARIKAPGFGAYAENGARIDQGLPEVREAARNAGVSYRVTVYPGVGHGFLRAREKPAVADQAWGDILAFFRDHLK